MAGDVRLSRIRVGSADGGALEAAYKQSTSTPADSTALSVLVRRDGAASTIFPAVSAGQAEYVHVFVGEGADDFASSYPGAVSVEAEVFPGAGTAGYVGRHREWTPETIFRFAFHRFRIGSDRAADFEADVAKEMAIVAEQEPGTVLYAFVRRDTPATLLPAAANGHTDYLHLMAFASEDAQSFHRELENRTDGWAWGPAFRPYLLAPLENESFAGPLIVGGTSTDSA